MASTLRFAMMATALGAGAAALLQAALLLRAFRRASDLARDVRCFEARPGTAAQSVLVLGDSTGLGVGAESALSTVPGLLASDYRGLRIDNLARNGARVDGVLDQLETASHQARRYDLLLLFVGGNDVVRCTPRSSLEPQVHRMLARSRSLASHVVWLGVANVGAAPVFLPPLSWWFSRRTRQLARFFAATASQYGVAFVDFFEERRDDRFSREPQRYYAADGVHPSGSSYRHCYRRAKREAGFDRCLAVADGQVS